MSPMRRMGRAVAAGFLYGLALSPFLGAIYASAWLAGAGAYTAALLFGLGAAPALLASFFLVVAAHAALDEEPWL